MEPAKIHIRLMRIYRVINTDLGKSIRFRRTQIRNQSQPYLQ